MIIILYEDDGPDGICGQSMDITMPWQRLIEIESLEQADKLVRLNSFDLSERLFFGGVTGSRGRKNARISAVFSDDYDEIELFGCKRFIRLGEL